MDHIEIFIKDSHDSIVLPRSSFYLRKERLVQGGFRYYVSLIAHKREWEISAEDFLILSNEEKSINLSKENAELLKQWGACKLSEYDIKKMKKWEYKQLDMLKQYPFNNKIWMDEIAQLGSDGWEMCGSSDRYLYFKRIINEEIK